jgi:hypothetical protein
MTRLLPLLSALILAAIVASAGAQGTAPPQPSCAGTVANDAAGDQVHSSPIISSPALATAGQENLDIKRVWFDKTGSKVTANIEIANLNNTVPADKTGISWYAEWTLGDAVHYVKAASEGSDYTFAFGTVNATSGVYEDAAGGTSGKVFEGPNGVVQLVIPADIGGKTGAKLEAPAATAFEELSTGVVGSLGTADRAPDADGGKTYTVADCAGGGTTPAPGTGGTTTPPAGTGSTPGTQPGSNRVVSAGTLAVKASSSLGSAKTAGKKKKASVKLQSTGKITKLAATLFTGSLAKPKVFAKGTLASINGKGTLKLKVSKKPKKGSYFLYLEGDQADGKRHSKQFKVKFAK